MFSALAPLWESLDFPTMYGISRLCTGFRMNLWIGNVWSLNRNRMSLRIGKKERGWPILIIIWNLVFGVWNRHRNVALSPDRIWTNGSPSIPYWLFFPSSRQNHRALNPIPLALYGREAERGCPNHLDYCLLFFVCILFLVSWLFAISWPLIADSW